MPNPVARPSRLWQYLCKVTGTDTFVYVCGDRDAPDVSSFQLFIGEESSMDPVSHTGAYSSPSGSGIFMWLEDGLFLYLWIDAIYVPAVSAGWIEKRVPILLSVATWQTAA